MGMQEDEYWAYTPAQYYKRFKIYQKRRDADLRDQAYIAYGQAITVLAGLGGKTPSMYEAYESLFEEELQKQRLAESKVNFMNFAKAFNEKLKQKGDNTNNG